MHSNATENGSSSTSHGQPFPKKGAKTNDPCIDQPPSEINVWGTQRYGSYEICMLHNQNRQITNSPLLASKHCRNSFSNFESCFFYLKPIEWPNWGFLIFARFFFLLLVEIASRMPI